MKKMVIGKKNKRAQFYLIAAVIIVAVILGFVAIQNYVKKKPQVKIYDLGDELGFEGGKVLEHGTFNPGDEKIDEFIEEYADYSQEQGRQIYFIYGNTEIITIATYEEVVVGEISIVIGGGNPTHIEDNPEQVVEEIPVSGQSQVEVIIGGHPYEFELHPGENFYFVISHEIEGETYITQG